MRAPPSPEGVPAKGRSERLASLEGYRVCGLIGEGRVAEIHLADDLRRGGKVAIKVLKGSRVGQGAIWQGFAAECAILSAIRDDNVVRVFEHQVAGDPAWLVMEYLPGGSLRERLRGGVSAIEAVSLLHQAARGLAAVHRHSIVHRDVKPENFLVRAPGTLVLADFGVAAPAGDGASRVAPGRLVGTASYASPEQLQGAAPSAAADVYSLGIIFYELLCGRRPFAGETVLELISQHLVAPIPVLSGKLAVYQPMIDGMLQKNPGLRLADADAVLRQIERMAIAGPVAA